MCPLDADVEDPPPHGDSAEVHVRQAHPGETGEVLHENQLRHAGHGGTPTQRASAVVGWGKDNVHRPNGHLQLLEAGQDSLILTARGSSSRERYKLYCDHLATALSLSR